MKLETLAVHLGRKTDPATGAVTPPIHLSTTFEREADGSYPQRHMYIRDSNPGREMLEECLMGLEGGAAAAAFSSGSAAMTAIVQSLAAGDHVIIPVDIYRGTVRIFEEIFNRWNLAVTAVDMTELDQVQAAMRPETRLIWVETPSNPLLKVVDIAQVAAIAHAGNALCACDDTWTTPVIQRPLDLGADLVVHATTKYLGGHGDVLGGAVIAKADDDFFQRLRRVQTLGGAVQSPFDAWLVMRGIRTLPYRMRAHSETAGQVAAFLSQHSQVEVVHYPGLKSHPDHALAARQMALFGGMLSVQVQGGQPEAMAVAAKVQLFTRATSLGGPESLIEHRASIEGPGSTTPPNLLRLSIGLEHADDLIADLEQALG
jgi:cystathionine gamma-synthase